MVRWVVYGSESRAIPDRKLGSYRWRWRAVVRCFMFEIIEGLGLDSRTRIEPEKTDAANH